MRSDESTVRRSADRDTLRAHLDRMKAGDFTPINEWYRLMDAMGLGRSDRQRLSELRKEGYDMRYSRKLGGYVYVGFSPDGQLGFPLEGVSA